MALATWTAISLIVDFDHWLCSWTGARAALTTAELGNALRAVGKRLTQAHITELNQKADKESAGKVNFEEFKKYVELASEVEKKDRDVEQAFKIFAQADGVAHAHVNPRAPGAPTVVDVQALRQALTTLGDKLSAK